MNKLDDIKNFNSCDYSTDSELSSSDLEHDINSKNYQIILNKNNRIKNKFQKHLHNINENKYLKEKINILLDRNYKLINLNNSIINNYEYNMKIYKIISSFLTTSLLTVCIFYYKNIK